MKYMHHNTSSFPVQCTKKSRYLWLLGERDFFHYEDKPCRAAHNAHANFVVATNPVTSPMLQFESILNAREEVSNYLFVALASGACCECY